MYNIIRARVQQPPWPRRPWPEPLSLQVYDAFVPERAMLHVSHKPSTENGQFRVAVLIIRAWFLDPALPARLSRAARASCTQYSHVHVCSPTTGGSDRTLHTPSLFRVFVFFYVEDTRASNNLLLHFDHAKFNIIIIKPKKLIKRKKNLQHAGVWGVRVGLSL